DFRVFDSGCCRSESGSRRATCAASCTSSQTRQRDAGDLRDGSKSFWLFTAEELLLDVLVQIVAVLECSSRHRSGLARSNVDGILRVETLAGARDRQIHAVFSVE